MKILGIIGGFGPTTTSEFFLSLISAWNKKAKTQRPEIIIWNASVNNFAEQKFIREGKCSKHFLPLLKSGVKTLENSGVDFLVLPCNSLHIFIEDIKKITKLPVLNILEETTKVLTLKGIGKIMLLGNEATVKSGLFNSKLKKNGIQIFLPTKNDQNKLNLIIHKLVLMKNTKSDTENFNKIVVKFKKSGFADFLLACTDLQLLKSNVEGVRFIDTLEILKNAAIEKMSE